LSGARRAGGARVHDSRFEATTPAGDDEHELHGVGQIRSELPTNRRDLLDINERPGARCPSAEGECAAWRGLCRCRGEITPSGKELCLILKINDPCWVVFAEMVKLRRPIA